MDIHRTEAAGPRVVLPRPLDLDRGAPVQRPGDRHRLDDHVGIGDGPPAEAAARLHHVQPDLVRRNPGGLGGDLLVQVRNLVPAPDFQGAVIVHPGDGVERLQRRMGQVGQFEGGFQRDCRR